TVLTDKKDRRAFDDALRSSKGDWTAALSSLRGKLSDATLQKLSVAHAIADWSGDNAGLVKAFVNTAGIAGLRDVALNYSTDKLATMIDPAQVPAGTAGSTPEEKVKNYAISLQHGLFATEPTAVLQRMVQDAEVPIAD